MTEETAGMTGGKHSTPTLVLPPQGGGNVRIFAMTEKKEVFF